MLFKCMKMLVFIHKSNYLGDHKMMDGDIRLFAASPAEGESGDSGGPFLADDNKIIVTNKNAMNPAFQPAFQVTREDIKEIEFYAPEMIRVRLFFGWFLFRVCFVLDWGPRRGCFQESTGPWHHLGH